MDAQQILQLLDQAGIPYQVVKHPPVYTSEQADEYTKDYDFARTKNLFLTTSHHNHYYLLAMPDDQRLDMQAFRHQIASPRLKFASADEMQQYLGVTPGMVSPLNLLTPAAQQVHFYVAKSAMREATVGCHPNDNRMTVILKWTDLLNLLRQHQVNVHEVTLGD